MFISREESKIFPYFQPVICVASGKIVGYEALARQYDDEQNIISAESLLNSSDLSTEELIEMDRQVRWLALKEFSELADKSTYLSLNISAAWIDYLSSIKSLPTLDMLDQLEIDRKRVIIEITEGAVGTEKLKAVVKKYRQQGMLVAIDDYGSGYSQLDRVLAVNPDVIKIDMLLFKRAMQGGSGAKEALQLLTRLGERLGGCPRTYTFSS